MSTISASTTSTTAYKVTADTTGTLVLQTGSTPTTAVTIGTDQSVTLAGTLAVQSQNISPYTGFKNRIINGAMVIDQRNAGASYSQINTGYSLDRWQGYSYTAGSAVTGKYTVQQNAGSVTPPDGLTNYLGVTSSAATSLTSTDIFTVIQTIEGYNVADLGWGTANAKTVTLSFWVRSSITGTYGIVLRNSAGNRVYTTTYTINSANTWEQKTITIPGDQSGTWLTNNGAGILLLFQLQVGSTFTVAPNSWGAGNLYGATGCVSLLATNGATWYITGVQLEKGSTATSFDYRPYGTELQLCQRYYFKNQASSGATYFAPGFCYSTTNAIFNYQFPVPMRTQPTALETTGTVGNYRIYSTSANSFNATAITFNNAETISSSFTVTTTGLTNSAGAFFISNVSSAYLAWSAEL